MEVSKNIRHGSAVTWRGDKLILASKRSKLVGVFNRESTIKGFALDGTPFYFEIPGGIRTYGEASVLAEGEMKP